QCPWWHRTALWGGWAGNTVLLFAVIVLGIWGRDSLSRPTCQRELADRTKIRCSQGDAGCKLCPSDWRLRGDKCYWVSTENKTWNKSRSDCAARGSQLLVIRDREELETLHNLTQSKTQLWVGLSHPSPEKAWTWLDGSQLDQTRLPVSGPAEGNSCGMMKGNRIHSQDCNSAHQWICQRD
uniref:C-type lectin domain-containing protein n=1 Tax=Pelodiscus sinensis TaxID=13735 RepID=K7GB08_PELSI